MQGTNNTSILRTLASPGELTFAATHDIELSYILEDCYKNYHLLGDFLAVAVGDLSIYYSKEIAKRFIGVHAGLTEDELRIPLILCAKKPGAADEPSLP